MAILIFKLGGALCVMIAAIGLGESKASTLGRRVHHLQLFQQSLGLLVTEISYAHSILPLAFQRVSRQVASPVKELYSRAAERLIAGHDSCARLAWEGAVRQVGTRTCYTEGDLEVIKALGVSLGESRKEGQLTQIELTAKRLEFLLHEAQGIDP